MRQLESMKEMLVAQVQGQLSHLESVDAKELGEVVDMIKDLSEAIYYCTVIDAMKESEHKNHQPTMYFMERPYYPDYRDMDRDMGRMYYTGSNSNGNGNGSRSNNTRGGGSMMSYTEHEYPLTLRDYREGRSPMNRKMYIESKELHHDKATQIKELEKYVQELGSDITEMIRDASPEEKQLLQQRIATLAQKINA